MYVWNIKATHMEMLKIPSKEKEKKYTNPLSSHRASNLTFGFLDSVSGKGEEDVS